VHADLPIAGGVGFVVGHGVLACWRFFFPVSYYLGNRSIALIDRDIGIRVAVGIGIGNVDAAERLPANDARTLGAGPVDGLEK
jgi:hypothetical protein